MKHSFPELALPSGRGSGAGAQAQNHSFWVVVRFFFLFLEVRCHPLSGKSVLLTAWVLIR